MRIFILGDGQGWVVDRSVQAIVDNLPHHEFDVGYYTKISREDFLRRAERADLVHYTNWDVKHLFAELQQINTPLMITIQSHRYDPRVLDIARRAKIVTVVNPGLLSEIPGAYFVPYGIFSQFVDCVFTVGMALNGMREYDYKGYHLVKQACKELGPGVVFRPADGWLAPVQMPDYYASLDLYVCASEAEGFSTPVMECLAMNVPVATTNVGMPVMDAELRKRLTIIEERSVTGIKAAISKHYTAPHTTSYFWEHAAKRFDAWYYEATK